MVAMYYGYREDGTSIWLLTSGDLQPSDADDVYWELKADLLEVGGGFPVGTELADGSHHDLDVMVAGEIHIEIMQRNLLRFSVNGGPIERMVPMVFGSHTSNYFPELSDYRLPNFEEGRELDVGSDQPVTPWMLVEMNPDGESRWGYAYSSRYPHWGSAHFSSFYGFMGYSFWFYDAVPHIAESAHVTCGPIDKLAVVYPRAMAGHEGNEPLCIAWTFVPVPGEWRTYFMPLGNFGDRRFTAVSEDGWVLEAYRLSYD